VLAHHRNGDAVVVIVAENLPSQTLVELLCSGTALGVQVQNIASQNSG